MGVCKDSALIYDMNLTKTMKFDMRNSVQTTWRDVIAAMMEDEGDMSLSEIYKKLEGYQKCEKNPHCKEKVRQILQKHDNFSSSYRGVWHVA